MEDAQLFISVEREAELLNRINALKLELQQSKLERDGMLERIAELVQNIREYGNHDSGCGAVRGGRCDCGWDQLTSQLMER